MVDSFLGGLLPPVYLWFPGLAGLIWLVRPGYPRSCDAKKDFIGIHLSNETNAGC